MTDELKATITPITASGASPAPGASAVAAPTSGEARNEHSNDLAESFLRTLQKLGNKSKRVEIPVIGWKVPMPTLRPILPGGIGTFDYTIDKGVTNIQTASRKQFQNNPIIMASIAQMMIEINRIDTVLAKNDPGNSIVAAISQNASPIAEATNNSIRATITDNDESKNPLLAQISDDPSLINNGNITPPLIAGFEAKKSGGDPTLGFEQKDPQKDSKFQFTGDNRNKGQPEVDHNHQDPLVRAFSFLTEMLLIIFFNAAKAKANATFDALAKTYQLKIIDLVRESPDKAAEYLNERLGSNSALDKRVQVALRRALGVPENMKEFKAAELTVSPKGELKFDTQIAVALPAETIDIKEKQENPARSVTYAIHGSEEEVKAAQAIYQATLRPEERKNTSSNGAQAINAAVNNNTPTRPPSSP